MVKSNQVNGASGVEEESGMKVESFLPDNYTPAEDEPFMNDRQLEYFRVKLLKWKAELLGDSKHTIEGLQDSTRNIPDIADRASEETDRALELRTRDRQRKLVAKIDSALRRIDEADPDGEGYDLNFALDGTEGPAAELVAPDGMRLRLWTDQPGLQVYTCGFLKPFAWPWPGVNHGNFAGICLEAQAFPNALNTPGFGSILVSPDKPYRQVTRIEIAQG